MKRDCRLVNRAVNNAWNTPPEMKQAIIRNIRSWVEGGEDMDLQTLLKVAETICKLDKSDMDALRLVLEAEKNEQPDKITVEIVYGGEDKAE